MGYQTDFSPIEYLQRRVIYYKKLRGNARNWHTDEYFIQRYGIKGIKKQAKIAIERYEKRIEEYGKAIELLTKNKTL